MRSDWTGPVNIGSQEMVTINGLATMIMGIAGKRLGIRHVSGPLGVRGRNSDEVWGDGGQTRSFLYIDECLEGTLRRHARIVRPRDAQYIPTHKGAAKPNNCSQSGRHPAPSARHTNKIRRRAKRPLLGFGYAGFWNQQNSMEVIAKQQWPISHAHNAYLDVLLETGPLGVLAFVVILLLGLRLCHNGCRQAAIVVTTSSGSLSRSDCSTAFSNRKTSSARC